MITCINEQTFTTPIIYFFNATTAFVLMRTHRNVFSNNYLCHLQYDSVSLRNFALNNCQFLGVPIGVYSNDAIEGFNFTNSKKALSAVL